MRKLLGEPHQTASSSSNFRAAYTGKECLALMQRARAIYSRLIELRPDDECIVAFVKSIVAFARYHDAVFGVRLRDDWQDALEQFRSDFMPMWHKCHQTGMTVFTLIS